MASIVAVLAASPARGAAPLVAVDVGHTRADPGAYSARGKGEFEFNRALALSLLPELAARGLRVLPINLEGDIARLDARPAAAREADLLISLHHDSARVEHLDWWTIDGARLAYSDVHRGFSLFVSRLNPRFDRSLTCASAIGARLLRAGFTPTFYHADRRPLQDRRHAVHAYDHLVVLKRATQAALLFEAGVIKHREEELLLDDPERRARMADALAGGVAACLQAGAGSRSGNE